MMIPLENDGQVGDEVSVASVEDSTSDGVPPIEAVEVADDDSNISSNFRGITKEKRSALFQKQYGLG